MSDSSAATAMGRAGTTVDSGMSTAEALAAASAALAEPLSLPQLYEAASGRTKAFYGMLLRMGLGDHTVIVTRMITKLCNNLRFMGDHEAVVQRTLATLNELIYSYSSGRLLLSLDVIGTQLLMNHGEEQYPFLVPAANTRYRTQFYSALARLVFMEDESERFEPFIAPLLTRLDQLAGVTGVRSEEVMRAVIGAARDLRGILSAAHNRPTYSQCFEALFPRHIGTLVALMDTWADTPAVAVPLLKAMTELVFNRGQRIAFGASSANGILLFRSCSEMLTAYARKACDIPITGAPSDYAARWKGVGAALTCLTRVLEGGYVNYGVFALYADPALDNALTSAFKLMQPCDPEEVVRYPKLALAYSAFLQDMCRSHMDYLAGGLDGPMFMRAVQTITVMLDSLQADISSQAAFALDHLATYYVRNCKKGEGSETVAALQSHLSSSAPSLFEDLMKLVFTLVVWGDIGNQWSLARPLLSLILAAEAVRENSFLDMRAAVIDAQAVSDQPRMADELDRLMSGITRTLDGMNRDRFQNRITLFRIACKEFSKAPS